MKLKNKILLSIAVALFVVAIVLLALKPEKTFNKVELSPNNIVSNYTKYSYMDTIVYVGLDSLKECDITIEVKKISEQAKANFSSEYELEGLIYGVGRHFVLWIDDGNRQDHIRIVSHELIHLKQYVSKQLIYDGFYVYWNRAKYDLKETDYPSRPWEADAFEKGVLLERKIRSALY